MLEILKLEKCDSYIIDQTTGLLGNTVIAQYPCILDYKKFYVWIGSCDLNLFGQSTVLNLFNLAESKGAEEVIFIINRDNKQSDQYARMFRIIDAKRIKNSRV